MDGGAWWAIYIVHGVAESRTRLSDFTFTFKRLSGEFAFDSWVTESRLCLDFISPLPAPGHFLRQVLISVINRNPALGI